MTKQEIRDAVNLEFLQLEELRMEGLTTEVAKKMWETRCRIFGSPPTFVSKEGVMYFEGPNEKEARKEISRKCEEMKDVWNNPDLIKRGHNHKESLEKLDRWCQQKLESARKQDKALQVR